MRPAPYVPRGDPVSVRLARICVHHGYLDSLGASSQTYIIAKLIWVTARKNRRQGKQGTQHSRLAGDNCEKTKPSSRYIFARCEFCCLCDPVAPCGTGR